MTLQLLFLCINNNSSNISILVIHQATGESFCRPKIWVSPFSYCSSPLHWFFFHLTLKFAGVGSKEIESLRRARQETWFSIVEIRGKTESVCVNFGYSEVIANLSSSPFSINSEVCLSLFYVYFVYLVRHIMYANQCSSMNENEWLAL